MKRAFAVLLTIAIVMSCAVYPLTATAEKTGVCSLFTSAGMMYYDSLAEAMENTEFDSTLTLLQDTSESVTVDKDMCLDLNGFSINGTVTVQEGYTLRVCDNQTDDYTVEDGVGYGTVAGVSGNVIPADGYLQITEDAGISYHRIYLKLTAVTLRCSEAGIYYTAKFCSDEVVAAQVKYYGVALRLNKSPDEAYMQKDAVRSWFTDFTPGAGGNAGSSTLLHNIISSACSTANNTTRAQSGVYARPYVQMKDGRYVFGTGKMRSLMQMVQEADTKWYQLTEAQRNEFDAMYRKHSAVMENWYLPNRNNTDIDVPI